MNMDSPSPAFTVLCIDDCEPTLDVLRASLSAWGYTALTATCGVDGLNLLSSHAVDILVLDYNMSGMNGETVARKARQAYPELPLVLFSGCSQEECSPVLSLVNQYIPKGTLAPLRHTLATLLAPEQQNPSTC